MTKFPSLWGDLEVSDDSITPAKEEKQTKVDDKTTVIAEKAATQETEEEEAARIAEEAKSSKGTEDTKNKDEEEEEEEYEFTPDDVSKAYTMLLEEGVLDVKDDEEFEDTTKGFADVIAATVRNKMEAEFAAIPDVVQQFYSHIKEGNDVGTFVQSNTSIKWEDFDDSTEEAKEQVLLTYHKSLGLSEEDAQEEVEDAKTAGKLDKKSSIALSSLIKNEEDQTKATSTARVKAKADAEKKRDDDVKALETTIDTTEEIAGFKLDKEKRTAFKEYLFKVNPRTGKTQMQENMADEERRMSIAFLDFVNYTKADLTKEVASKLTKTRRKKLTRYSDTNVKNSNSSSSIKTKVNKKAGKVVFPSIFGSQTIEIED